VTRDSVVSAPTKENKEIGNAATKVIQVPCGELNSIRASFGAILVAAFLTDSFIPQSMHPYLEAQQMKAFGWESSLHCFAIVASYAFRLVRTRRARSVKTFLEVYPAPSSF
jgi:hypothetical protein